MRKTCKMFVLVMLSVLILGGALEAQDRERDGAVRGTFVRLIEQETDQGQVMGIIVNPFERDDPVTALVPRENEDLRQAARRLREGQIVEIAFAPEGRGNWLRRLEADRARDQGGEKPEGTRAPAVDRQARREPRQSEDVAESGRARTFRSDEEADRSGTRRKREVAKPLPRIEQMQEQLRDVFAGHTERMANAVREVLRAHLGQMEREIRELRANMERMEKQMQEVRAENERLKTQLRTRGEPARERERQVREQTEPQHQRQNRQTEERGVQRDQDQKREPAPSPQ